MTVLKMIHSSKLQEHTLKADMQQDLKITQLTLSTKKAIADHVAAYSENPGAFYIEAYSAIIAVTEAIKAAGSTDYDKLVAALRNNW